jgi:hypothetical protein
MGNRRGGSFYAILDSSTAFGVKLLDQTISYENRAATYEIFSYGSIKFVLPSMDCQAAIQDMKVTAITCC